MFTSFPITQVDRIVRRTLISALIVAVVAMAAAIAIGYPLVAPGVALGMVMGVLNHRVFQASAVRFIDEEGAIARKPFAGSVFLRLGACTAVALAALVFVRPMGWGIIGALAMFQALLLLNSIVALIGYQRSSLQSNGEGSPGGV